MIKQNYDDDKKHVHVLSYGGGTQSTALLLMALKGEVNGVIPDYIVFSDTGWEGKRTYDWIDKVNKYIKVKYNREIVVTDNGNIREDILSGRRFASMPFYTRDKEGQIGMVKRQCTGEYKITPVNKKIRELLGYKPRQRIKEVVHLWKGISVDEIQRVKPSFVKWQIAEHPLVDIADMDRSNCIAYVEREGLGTPEKSSCVGCPFHDAESWREIKIKDSQGFKEVIEVDKAIRNLPRFRGNAFLHRSCFPIDEIDFQENQMTIDDFINECEGMCGV